MVKLLITLILLLPFSFAHASSDALFLNMLQNINNNATDTTVTQTCKGKYDINTKAGVLVSYYCLNHNNYVAAFNASLTANNKLRHHLSLVRTLESLGNNVAYRNEKQKFKAYNAEDMRLDSLESIARANKTNLEQLLSRGSQIHHAITNGVLSIDNIDAYFASVDDITLNTYSTVKKYSRDLKLVTVVETYNTLTSILN